MKLQTYKDQVEEIQKKMVDLVKSVLNFEFTELFIHCVNEEEITGFNFFVEKNKELIIDNMLGLDPNVLNNIKNQGLALIKEVEDVSKSHTKEIPTIMEVLYFVGSGEIIPLSYRYDKICHQRGKTPEMLCSELLEKYKKEYSSIVYIQKNDGMVIMKKGVFCYYLENAKWVHEQGLFSNFNGGYNDWKYIEEADVLKIMEDMKQHPEMFKKANNDISNIDAKKIIIAILVIAVIIAVVYFVKRPKTNQLDNNYRLFDTVIVDEI